MLLKDYIINQLGSRYNSKLIIFQSDDWGSIRMPSLKVRESLKKNPAIDVNNDYCNYDTLASSEDIECLFEVLTSVKDCNNNHPIITANCVLTNPDFKKIKNDNYQNYYYYDLKTTFQKYNNEKALGLWHEGINYKLFSPQFHGREHVNVPFWLDCLKNDIPGVKYAFEHEVFGVSFKSLPRNQKNFQRAWDLLTPNSKGNIDDSILDGLKLFEKQFGYKSRTVIAPNYTWSKEQEKLLFENGVEHMQGILRQRIPISYDKPYKYKYRFTKSYNNNRMGYLRRNVFFEPSLSKENFSLDKALAKIDMAFKAKKPAIIGTHRINFVGVHDVKKRDHNLGLLKKLLKSIIKNWPDAIFKASPAIGYNKNENK